MVSATARSRSASAKTISGAAPPNSIDTRFRVGAHCSASMRPTPVEPVKLSLRISGLSVIALPMIAASPVTTDRAPTGRPA